MGLNLRVTFLYVFIPAALLCTVEADSGEPECEVIVLVRRHTEYEAVVGENLKIECPVRFCNNSPPTVSWYKDEQSQVPVDVSSSSQFKTEWKTLNHLEGASYLMIENIVRNDTGVYRCRTNQSVGHGINISVIGEEPECEVTVLVHRHTEYKAAVGGNLTISCPVRFCNNSPPTVSWYKGGHHDVPVNVSSSSRFKTEWKTLKHFEGVYYLIFQNMVTSDLGLYHCEAVERGGRLVIGHFIRVSQETANTLWPSLYRVVGIMGFAIIVITIFVTSNSLRKGVSEGGSKDKANRQSSHDALPMDLIYEIVE